MYSRYEPSSKFSCIPTANPSTAYFAGSAVAFAHKTRDARTAIFALTPLPRIRDGQIDLIGPALIPIRILAELNFRLVCVRAEWAAPPK